jgi:hypothetical protein
MKCMMSTGPFTHPTVAVAVVGAVVAVAVAAVAAAAVAAVFEASR